MLLNLLETCIILHDSSSYTVSSVVCNVVFLAGVLSYCIAPTRRHLMCAQLVMQTGINVNTCDIRGIPVLVHACETAHENEQICLLMLQNGADPTKKNEASFIYWIFENFIKESVMDSRD